MNKTINVNIAGFSFTLDEEAHARLKEYLDRLTMHFSREEGSDEIMQDIESRLAEMLIDLLGKKHVVSLTDVQVVIKQMGMPEDFEVPEDETQPKQEHVVEEEITDRRFYRDTENAVVGGVCSGISSYFNVDPIWLRIAFVVGLFVFGSGLLLYLVLWIIMPEARTTADRLRMKGRRTTVSNIERSFRESMREAGQEIRRAAKESNVRSGFERFVDRSGGTFIKLIGIAFVIIGIFVLAGLIAGLVGGGGLFVSWFPHLQQHLLSPGWPQSLSIVTLILLIGIPVFVLLVKGVTYLMRIKFKSRLFNGTMLLAWFVGVAFAVAIGVDLGTDFSNKGTYRFEEQLQPTGKTILIKPSDVVPHYGRSHHDLDVDHMQWTGDTLVMSKLSLNITESIDSTVSLVTAFKARGRTHATAMKRASQIEHSVSMSDSTLLISPWFTTGDEPWRVQRVELTLQVPAGYSVRVSRDLSYTLIEEYTYNRDRGDATIRF